MNYNFNDMDVKEIKRVLYKAHTDSKSRDEFIFGFLKIKPNTASLLNSNFGILNERFIPKILKLNIENLNKAVMELLVEQHLCGCVFSDSELYEIQNQLFEMLFKSEDIDQIVNILLSFNKDKNVKDKYICKFESIYEQFKVVRDNIDIILKNCNNFKIYSLYIDVVGDEELDKVIDYIYNNKKIKWDAMNTIHLEVFIKKKNIQSDKLNSILVLKKFN